MSEFTPPLLVADCTCVCVCVCVYMRMPQREVGMEGEWVEICKRWMGGGAGKIETFVERGLAERRRRAW